MMYFEKIKVVSNSHFSKIIIAYIVVLAFQFILLYPLHRSSDLPLSDEPLYMGFGITFGLGISKLPSIAWGPGYALLYSIFTRLFGTINSIFFMKYFLSISVTLLILTFLLQNIKSYLVSVFLSLLWAMSLYNIDADNMVYHFALLVFLLALICCNKIRLLTILFLLLCSFIRLEYISIFICYLVYLTTIFLKNKKIKNILPSKNINKVISIGIALLLLTLIFYMSINLQNWDGASDRIWHAFKQNYSLVTVNTGHYNFSPTLDYNIIIAHDFPNSHSVFSAFLVNPKLFTIYVIKNIINLPLSLLYSILPTRHFKYYIYIYVLLLLFFYYFIYIYILKHQQFIIKTKNILFKLKDIFILFLIAFLLSISSSLIYTRFAYSLILIPFILLFVGISCKILIKLVDYNFLLIYSLIVLIFVFFFFILKGPMPFREIEGKQRLIYNRISKLKEIWPAKKIKLLGASVSLYAGYLGFDRCIPLELFTDFLGKEVKAEKTNLEDLLIYYNPDAVLVNQGLLDAKRFDKKSLQTFLKVLSSESWVEYDLGGVKIYFRKKVAF